MIQKVQDEKQDSDMLKMHQLFTWPAVLHYLTTIEKKKKILLNLLYQAVT